MLGLTEGSALLLLLLVPELVLGAALSPERGRMPLEEAARATCDRGWGEARPLQGARPAERWETICMLAVYGGRTEGSIEGPSDGAPT